MALFQPCRSSDASAENAMAEFNEWASLFSGELFVKLVVYADESGTHDEAGQQPGSSVPVIGGYIAYKHEWTTFCGRWKAALDGYKLRYFHYIEWRDAVVAISDGKPETPELHVNPFYKLSLNELLKLQYDLAEIAGSQIPICGIDWLRKRKELFPDDNRFAFNATFGAFFMAVIETLEERPSFTEKIAFFMDQKTPEWELEFTKIHAECTKRGLIRSNERAFADKMDHLPLQAADMYAYRARTLAVPHMETQSKQPATVLDIMLNRKMHPLTGFRPVMTDQLRAEIEELAAKYQSVHRALSEVPNNDFGLK